MLDITIVCMLILSKQKLNTANDRGATYNLCEIRVN